AITRLPDERRRTFLLVQIHDQPIAAVAQIEGVPVGTIKSRLHRARAQLLALLGPSVWKVKGEGHASPRRA
ncbi:MAG TPA: sigma factor-like helix-turn-helix DNA-binding protein, partial [Myxococcaceae bacterium]|nr:sigma factor-like helix-turn-helix DNA-binding protein [Myxococcaceae bacterium]